MHTMPDVQRAQAGFKSQPPHSRSCRQARQDRRHLRGVAADAGLPADEGFRRVQQRRGVALRLGHDLARQAVGLLQQRLEQVLRLHDLLRVLLRDVRCRRDRLTHS